MVKGRDATGRPLVPDGRSDEIARNGIVPTMMPVFRAVAATLALSAMLVRAFLPAGWMPNPGAGAPIVICSIDGTHSVPAPHAPDGKEKDSHGFVCPFAAAAHLAPPRIAAPLTAPILLGQSAPAFTTAIFVSTPSPHQHAPRGPPASV
jgi:hypothetical protein